MQMLGEKTPKANTTSHMEAKEMLRTGSAMLSIWSGINLLVSAAILTMVVVFRANSPILDLVFEKSEVADLSTKVIASLNALTILYNSCSVVLSVVVWFIIRNGLIAGQRWAFWTLLFGIGFVEAMAFVASAPIGNARWQLYVAMSALYTVGLVLAGYSIFRRQAQDSDAAEERVIRR
jgi:hypothetical protein